MVLPVMGVSESLGVNLVFAMPMILVGIDVPSFLYSGPLGALARCRGRGDT